jgi:hypothetical protein
MKPKMKRILLYTIDLEPLSFREIEILAETYVFNRSSTNSLTVWAEQDEVELDEEWSDDIKWNRRDIPLSEYEKMFNKNAIDKAVLREIWERNAKKYLPDDSLTGEAQFIAAVAKELGLEGEK